jgi:hypothetical protein
VIVVTACGKSKALTAQPAGLLYTGSYASAGIQWATTVVPKEHIYVLSALYGLVPYWQVIEPYDLTLGQPGAVRAPAVRHQAERFGVLDEPEVVAVGAKRYRDMVLDVWPHAMTPFTQGGMGLQMAAMRSAKGAVPA